MLMSYINATLIPGTTKRLPVRTIAKRRTLYPQFQRLFEVVSHRSSPAMKSFSRFLALLAMCVFAVSGFAQQIMESDQLPVDALRNSTGKSVHITPNVHRNGMDHARQGVPNVDSLVNWNDQFFADGVDNNNQPVSRWFTNMVGNPPNNHGTTTINAPIVPVIMDLRNADGTPRFVNGKPLVSSPQPFIQKVLESPVFSNYTYSSSTTPTQFTDAVQRAEYFSKAKADWHTVLAPSVKTTRTMVLKRGTYQF